MIPKKIHFIYGLTENFINKPFSFFHYLAVLSAKKCNNCDVFFHLKYEPVENEWWEKTKLLVNIEKIIDIPDYIFEKKILFTEHKCDIIRLKILNECGGIYLDIDTICNKPFDDLLSHECVMGIEKFKGKINGLCNAVILSSPNNPFLMRWLESYVYFIPGDWNQMPVRKPYELSQKFQSEIHVEQQESFFKYDWHTIIDIFNKDVTEIESYVIHLWESKLYHPILKHITIEDVMNRDCLYNSIARRYI